MFYKMITRLLLTCLGRRRKNRRAWPDISGKLLNLSLCGHNRDRSNELKMEFFTEFGNQLVLLPLLLLTYRFAIHESTKETRAKVNFGRKL